MKKHLLSECIRIAKKKNTPELHPEWGNYHHFSFIVQGSKIIEWGTNRGVAIPIHGFNIVRHKLHAEVDAYKKAQGLLKRNQLFEVLNIRLNKQNKLRLAAPCKCCTSFLSFNGCKKIFYTTNKETVQVLGI